MSAKSKQAVKRFRRGFNCSQAVLSIYSEQFGLDKEAKEKGLFSSICPEMVQDAVEILEEMLAGDR